MEMALCLTLLLAIVTFMVSVRHAMEAAA